MLAYYIAAINIENAFNSDPKNYFPFQGIVFQDTFKNYESRQQTFEEFNFQENFSRAKSQMREKIEIIIGNPPYSIGKKSYSEIDKKITETYAKFTDSTNKNSLYDSYIRAFRWASDRIEKSGVIGFITNSSWIDKPVTEGLRKIFSEEFSQIFIFNLRGNQRTQGEISRKEGGNIFENYILLGDKKNNSAEVFFDIYSRGIETGRDSWIYNFSKKSLQKNISSMIEFYNKQREKFKTEKNFDMNAKKISWTS